MEKERNSVLPSLHDTQVEVMRSPARVRIVAKGRRWGGTRLGAAACLDKALWGKHAWWIFPNYPMAEHAGWRLLKKLLAQVPKARFLEDEWAVEVPSGGTIMVTVSSICPCLADDLDLVVLDEPGLMLCEIWDVLKPHLLLHPEPKFLFTGTPPKDPEDPEDEEHWFYTLWDMAQEREDWQTWRFPTSANPYIEAEHLEALRRAMPESVYLREIGVQFLSLVEKGE